MAAVVLFAASLVWSLAAKLEWRWESWILVGVARRRRPHAERASSRLDWQFGWSPRALVSRPSFSTRHFSTFNSDRSLLSPLVPYQAIVLAYLTFLADDRPVALFEELLEEGVVRFNFEERKVADEDLGGDREISRLALPSPRVEVNLQRTVKSGMILFDVAAEFGVVGSKMDEEDARLRRADVEEGEVTAEADPPVVKGEEAHLMHSLGVMEIPRGTVARRWEGRGRGRATGRWNRVTF
jgi:hypothetical protein